MPQSKNITTELPAPESVFEPVTDEAAKATAGTAKMDLHEAMHFIEGREADERFAEARGALKQRLGETDEYEEKGTCYYYLLRLMLREHLLFENKEARENYQKMRDNFVAAEKDYKKSFAQSKDKNEKRSFRSQIEAFYQLIESYFVVLEKIYLKKGFLDANERVYVDKMHFRKRFAFFSGRHFAHLGHFFLDKTSHYGHSLGRWGITVALFISVFAAIFGMLDYISPTSMFTHYEYNGSLFDYFYFSVVTFTTLGYGDIVPVTLIEKLVVGFEVLLGFTMLGIFINLIKKRFG